MFRSEGDFLVRTNAAVGGVSNVSPKEAAVVGCLGECGAGIRSFSPIIIFADFSRTLRIFYITTPINCGIPISYLFIGLKKCLRA